MMRRAILSLVGFAVLSSVSTATGATVTPRRPLIVTSQDHSVADSNDCQTFHTSTFTTLPANVTAEEKHDFQLVGRRELKVRTGTEGGVSVHGWNRPYARLTVCKSAVALTDSQARRALAAIKVSIGGNEIVARGPEAGETQNWWVNMILMVPKAAELDVTAANGGIAIRNMIGRVTARSTNGGISIAGCDGDHHLQTKNGGISIDKVSGRVHAMTEGGPISLKLRDLAVPPLEAVTDAEGEIRCNLKGCGDGLSSWADNRKRLRIGEEAPSIRLTSVSADIMIEQVR
jgi:hypothetical protein